MHGVTRFFLFSFREFCFPIEKLISILKTHTHKNCTIIFCEKCWWKEIYLIDYYDLIYMSSKACMCKFKNDFHQELHVKICRLMKAIEWYSIKCSLDSKSNVRHINIYPTKYEEDFDIFYTCLEKKRTWTYPKAQMN